MKAGVLPRRFYIGRMKTISLLFVAALIAVSFPARAQDAALEERVNKLNGYVQDLLAAQEAQRKQIDALAQEVQSLRDKIGQSNPNTATQDDLRKLAEKLQEVDRKREADRDLILKEIEALGKSTSKQKPVTLKPIPAGNTTTSDAAAGKSAANEKGYEYEVKAGDTLSAIVAEYREQGIKVTVDQILKANPGLKATTMKVGQKIFIPAPQQ